MKTMQGKIAWGIILLVWIATGMAYQMMPEQIATHWDVQGVANGYSSKMFGLLLIPIIMTVIQLFFVAIPHIDPLKKNIPAFKKQVDGFALLMVVFMTYLFCITLAWNLGTRFSMNMAIAPAFGLLFYNIGSLLKGVQRNWFIGIRTPWTLSSDEVWDKTHRVGSIVFRIVGITALVGVVVPTYAVVFMIAPALVGALGIVVYSYILFRAKK